MTISDPQYADTQIQVQTFSRILLSIDPETLEGFIARADLAHSAARPSRPSPV